MLRGLLDWASCCSHAGLQQQHSVKLLQCRVGVGPVSATRYSWSRQLPTLHGVSTVPAAAGTDSTPDGPAEPARRRRRKLFNTGPQSPEDDQSPQLSTAGAGEAQHKQQRQQQRLGAQGRQQPQQQKQQQEERQRQLQTQQQQQKEDSRQEEASGWWKHPAAASELLLHVFWDLDNLKPQHWDQAEQLVGLLKSELRPLGRLQQLQAYANSHTLVSRVDTAGIEDMVEAEDELRCPICGRHCKSFDDLQKHFRQLHEREHKKKLRGSKKFADKYAQSDKAARVRDAGRLYGTPKKNRSGRRGQMVKVVLQRAGVKVIEVASQRQAADYAINRHMEALIEQLAAADPKPPSAPRLAATTTASRSGQDLTLESHLRTLDSAQACLDEMMEMSEDDVRVAWRYLRRMGTVKEKRRQWQTLWIELEQERRTRDPTAPRAPWWLSSAWDEHQQKRQKREEERRAKQETEAAAAAADAAEAAPPPPWGSSSALQQSVLVLISDDRGFATSVARWLRSGAAGAVLVTTRGGPGWERPLEDAKGCDSWPRHAVGIISWDGIVSQLEPVFEAGGGWELEEEWDDAFDEDQLGSYEWMVSEGLL